jgi:CRP-like cAMP-binding protein
MNEEQPRVIHSSFWANLFKSPTDKSDLENVLKMIPPFAELNKRDISMLTSFIHIRQYVPGEYIFHQGDPGIGLYVIREGEVLIQRALQSGETIPLAIFKKGDFFGELALVDNEERSASAIAQTDCRLAVVFKPDLDDFIEKYPKKGIKILQGISHIIVTRLRQLNEDHIALQSKLLNARED